MRQTYSICFLKTVAAAFAGPPQDPSVRVCYPPRFIGADFVDVFWVSEKSRRIYAKNLFDGFRNQRFRPLRGYLLAHAKAARFVISAARSKYQSSS
jgi:hypothetical protein